MHPRISRGAVAVALIVLSAASAAQPTAEAGALGRWITESGNLEVEIAPCADALCGKVVRVIANRSMQGPGEAVAADSRPALGMQILSDLHADGDGVFFGQIYNREKAKYYSVRLTNDGPQQLLVRGYVGLPLFGKTQLWRRAEAAAEPH